MKLFKKARTIYRDDHIPYLKRWNLFECRWFSIKIHKIMASDYDCQHDHPWAFLSLILKGGYIEYTPDGSRLYHPGNILYRPAKFTHRLEIHQTCWTFVITFKKVREWGFYAKYGWIPWFRYVDSRDGGCND